MKYVLILLIPFCLCSCIVKRKLYSPTQINNPSLQKKNDHSFSLTYSSPSGFDVTGGYAFTNRLAIIAGAYAYRNSDNQIENLILSNNTINADILYKHKGFHGGLGFYFPLSKKSNSTYASFFGGYTAGNFRMTEHQVETDRYSATTTRDPFYTSDIGQYFLQGGINVYAEEFEILFLTRYNYVAYNNVNTDYPTGQQISSNMPTYGYSKNSQFLDFGVDGKLYFTKDRRFGLQFFGSCTARLNPKEFNFYYYQFRLGAGIVVKNPFQKK